MASPRASRCSQRWRCSPSAPAAQRRQPHRRRMTLTEQLGVDWFPPTPGADSPPLQPPPPWPRPRVTAQPAAPLRRPPSPAQPAGGLPGPACLPHQQEALRPRDAPAVQPGPSDQTQPRQTTGSRRRLLEASGGGAQQWSVSRPDPELQALAAGPPAAGIRAAQCAGRAPQPQEADARRQRRRRVQTR